eukprot:GHUV01030056.1.p1 GENE.GHUV01030056.1~~GHUV01030056.1.p1  ORF type:complete len:145 (-),score=47.77 GHUV01030056.1:352-786(-)
MAPAAGMPAAPGHFGAMGLQQGPQGSVGSLGFTSVGSWAPGGLNPAASTGSIGSTGLLDSHAAAPAPAVGGGGLGFDDNAFGPVDDWRVLGDVQQWHRALLNKEKVSHEVCRHPGRCMPSHGSQRQYAQWQLGVQLSACTPTMA